MSELTIVDTSMCKCDKGVAPGILSVTSQQIVKTNGLLHATEADKIITPFGMCAITRSPCAMALIVWQNTARHTKVNGMKYLTEKSKIRCGVGGEVSFIKSNQTFVKCIGSGASGGGSASPRATVTSTGVATSTQINQNQAANPTSVQQQDDTTTTTQEQQNEQDTLITAIQWHDGTSNLAINDTNYGDTIYLTAQITNPQGSTAKVIITKEDGSKFSTFKKQLKSTATIGEDGSIKISSLEIDQEWDDYNTGNNCNLIGTIEHDDVTAQSEKLKIIPLANALVYFRPSINYNGEFGMDFIRNTNLLDTISYKDVLLAPKEYSKLEKKAYGIVDLPWYEKLMKKDKDLMPYTNTYVSLKQGKSATLSLFIESVALEIDITKEVTLEYDTSIFSIDQPKLMISASPLFLNIQNDAITITCKQSFAEDQIIKVLDNNRQLGQITMVSNDKARHIDVLLVAVTTDITNTSEPVSGKPTESDETMIHKTLGQALCTAAIDTLDFDMVKLSNEHDKLIENYLNLNSDGAFVLNSYHNSELGGDNLPVYLEKVFLAQPNNTKYANHHKVFYVGDMGMTRINGTIVFESLKGSSAEISNAKSAVVFSVKDSSTSIHELLHCIGLTHTFYTKQRYGMKKYKTRNIMDYNDASNHLWHRQWKKLWNILDKK